MGQALSLSKGQPETQGFDKLSPNGTGAIRTVLGQFHPARPTLYRAAHNLDHDDAV
jgi:hypothetical protein